MERLEELPAAEVRDPPDWALVPGELPCPLCEYNLRGLTEPRCPECGYRFEWRDLTDPERRRHPYLFEHHPGRNHWSFWKTAYGGLRPLRFWRSLTPRQPSRPGRLFAYWAITALAALFGAACPYLLVGGRLAMLANQPPPRPARYLTYVQTPTGRVARWVIYTPRQPPPPTPEAVVRAVGPRYLVWWAWAVAWPWLTYATLLVFRWSMRRARVKPIHVRRCVLYSGDVLLWAGVGLLAMTAVAGVGAASATMTMPSSTIIEFYDAPVVVLLVCLVLFAIARLGIAYQRYLQFDHPWATVIASQLIIALLVLNQMELSWGTVTQLLSRLMRSGI